MDPRGRFGENLRRARLQANLSQEDLAFQSGLDRTYVSGIERGVRNPTIAVVVQLADVLEIPPADLLDGLGRRAPRSRQQRPPKP
jgi:transcriptional regulator with XRE-family HTH domain